MTSDILVNEISDFIVYNTKTIVDAMNKSGVKISESDSDEEIVDALAANLGSNAKLSKAIAFIIADSNELINNGKGDKKKWTGIVDEIAVGVNNVGKGISSNKVAFKEDALQHIKTKADSKGDYKRTILKKDKPSSRGIKILIGSLAVLGVFIFIISRIQKRDMAVAGVPAMATGGTVTPDLTLPPPPVAPAPINPAPIVEQPIAPIQTPVAPVAPVNPMAQPNMMV